jgi:hypothetical protein
MFSNKKIGGIRFIRIGLLNVSYSVKKVAKKEVSNSDFVMLATASLFGASGMCSLFVYILSQGV